MATNLHIDDKLLGEAQKLGKHKTKRDAVNQALASYVRSMKREGLIELFGSVDFDPDYDYKAQRRRDTGPRRDRSPQ
jgi:Arc/MetJ family transcription regulator